jgi:hypothetical protein
VRAYLFEPTHAACHLRSILPQEEPIQRWIASLFIVLWSRLDWPMPDRVAVIPSIDGSSAIAEIGEAFARMIDRLLKDEFRWRWVAPFQWRLERREKDLLENQFILLIDWASSLENLRPALRELWPAFPGKIYILTIFGHD